MMRRNSILSAGLALVALAAALFLVSGTVAQGSSQNQPTSLITIPTYSEGLGTQSPNDLAYFEPILTAETIPADLPTVEWVDPTSSPEIFVASQVDSPPLEGSISQPPLNLPTFEPQPKDQTIPAQPPRVQLVSSSPSPGVLAPPQRPPRSFIALPRVTTSPRVMITPTNVITGTVRDSQGVPLSGANINATGAAGSVSTLTNPDGTYTLGVSAGTWMVWANKGGYVNPSGQAVTVPPDATGINFVLVTATGTISGMVRDGSNNPIVGATVSAWSELGGTSTNTAANGTYVVGVITGTWFVNVVKLGLVGSPGQDITVPPNASGVNFTMVSSTNIITGMVRDSNSNPVQGAHVDVRSGSGYNWTNSAADGTYTLEVTAGTWSVQANFGGAYVNPNPRDVTVPPNATSVNFVLGIPTNTIKGTVRDSNNNPVLGANVHAWNEGGHTWTSTGPDGTYNLAVTAGTWQVNAHRFGYFGPSPRSITVPPNATGIDLTLLAAPYTISGVVRDGQGNPMALAQVDAWSDIGGTGATTAQDGSYTVRVPAGTWNVRPRKDGYVSPRARLVTVPPNATGIDFTLPVASNTVSGTVRDQNGVPIAQVRVNASSDTHESWTDTANDGSYTLRVITGTWKVSANKDGYFGPPSRSVTVPPNSTGIDFTLLAAPYTISGVVRDGQGNPMALAQVDAWSDIGGTGATTAQDGSYTARVPAGTWNVRPRKDGYVSPKPRLVTVPPNATGIDFTLPVATNTISGTVRDQNNAPIAQAHIYASSDLSEAWADTANDGSYTLQVITGTWKVSANKDGYFGPPSRSVTVPPNSTGIDFTLLAAPYTISGVVRDGQSNPVPFANVGAWSDIGGTGTNTAQDGSYTVKVPAGTWNVRPSKDGYVSPNPPRLVTVPPNATGIDFTMALPTNTISGTVRDQSNNPFAGVDITAWNDSGQSWAKTGPDGSYSLGVITGTWNVRPWKDGYVGLRARVTVPPNATGIDFALLLPTNTISGTVRDQNGVPVAQAKVNASTDTHEASSNTANDGSYILQVITGTWKVSANKDGYLGAPDRQVTVPPNATGIDFTLLAAPYTISGVVRDGQGNPVDSAQVDAWNDTGGTGTSTAQDGSYTINVPAGTWNIRPKKTGCVSPKPRLVTVPPNATGVDFTLPVATNTISGTVRDSNNNPIAAARINGSSGDYDAWTDTAGDGTYTLQVITGTWTVSVNKDGYLNPASRQVAVPPNATGIDFTLLAAPYTISGVVRDGQGNPVALANVGAWSDIGGTGTKTAQDGSYTVKVPAGTWNVRPSKEGYVSPNPPRLVTVPPNATGVDFAMALPTNTISGTVRDQNNNPFAGVDITAWNDTGQTWSKTGPDGSYSLGVITGTWNVRPWKDGYVSLRARLVTVPPNATGVDFTMALPTNTISGTVRDQNGVPVAQAKVNASTDTHEASSSTANDGSYTLQVTTGTWKVSANKEGYFGPPSRSVTVPPNATGVDFTLLAAAYTVSGVVRDQGGNPVPSAQIDVWGDVGKTGTQAGPDGSYTVNVPAGSWNVRPRKDGYVSPKPRLVTVPPNATGIDFTLPLATNTISGTVRDQNDAPIAQARVNGGTDTHEAWTDTANDGTYTLQVITGTWNVSAKKDGYISPAGRQVTVPPNATGIDFTLPPAYKISGTVRDSNGNPVADAEVRTWGPGQSVRTGANGTYTLTVAAATYTVVVRKAGLVASPGQRIVTVPPNATGVDFTMVPRTNIIMGTVRDDSGTPVQGATVQAQSPQGFNWTETASDGSYILDVFTGTWRLSASKSGYFSPPGQYVTVPPNAFGIDFTLTRPAYTISGTARDSNNNPVADATVIGSGPNVSASTRTGSDGTYKLNVITGTWKVFARKPGLVGGLARVVTVPPNATGVDLTMVPTTNIITGTVRDENGAPVNLAYVQAQSSQGFNWTNTAADGSYTLEVFAGTWRVEARKAGYFNPPDRDVTVPPNAIGIDFTLRSTPYTISGVVRDERGVPVASAQVKVWSEIGSTETQTAQDGSYTAQVPTGTWNIAPTKYGYMSPPTRQVTVPPNATGVDFTMTRATNTISGTVRDNNNSPIAGADVLAARNAPNWEVHGYSGPDGSYSLPVITGTWTVTAVNQKDGYVSPSSRQVTVPPNATGIDFTLVQATNTISGTVRESNNNLVSGANLYSRRNDGYWAYAQTGPEGTYTLPAITGTWTVSASKENYLSPPSRDVTVPPNATGIDFVFQIGTGSISGLVAYTGEVTGTHTVYVGVLPNTRLENPIYVTSREGPGAYTITKVVSGTYYIASILDADDNWEPSLGDPFSWYLGQGGPAPVIVPEGALVTGINITVTDRGEIAGKAFLQGRSDHRGISITIGGPSGGTDQYGNYTIGFAWIGTQTVTATASGYLYAVRQGVVVHRAERVVLPDVTLVAGDVKNDGVINILDLVTVAAAFGSDPTKPHWNPGADLNKDNKVNIQDLVLVAINFGKRAPVPWP